MPKRDYFAELFVAGRFADAGWNVYFPHRDEGFDFIITKSVSGDHQIIRPVQVKGKYPTEGKTDKAVYGYVGELSQVHPEMVLAVPFFGEVSGDVPSFVAYLPYAMIRPHSKGYRCQPAAFKDGIAVRRRDHRHFFDAEGMKLIERSGWGTMTIGRAKTGRESESQVNL